MIFMVLGFGIFVGGLVFCLNTYLFVSNGIETKGVVKDFYIEEYRDSDGDKQKTKYLIISFNDVDGREITFETNKRTENYTIRNVVNVLYNSNNHYDAEIGSANSFDWYFFPAAVILFGVIFFTVGYAFLWILGLKSFVREKQSKDFTKIIKAKVISTGLNTRVSINDRNPYQIIAEWKDSNSGKKIQFKSPYFWKDPTPFTPEEVTVKIHRNKIKRYYMDTSFLPKTN